MQEQAHKNQLNVDIYHKITESIEHAYPNGVAVSLDILIQELQKRADWASSTGKYVPPPFDPSKFNQEFRKAHTELYKLMNTMEKYEILLPESFVLFRKFLGIEVKKLLSNFMDCQRYLPFFLLAEDGIEKPEQLETARGNHYERFKESVNVYYRHAYDITGYLHDILIEAQNHILGDVGKKKLKPRQPKDSSIMVLSSKDQKVITQIKEILRKHESELLSNIHE